ncbi:hypothetical protein Ciccas_002593 [Cichlidogyrus casuarinus]|uniref:Uncharacterized protein n=1 Tax=Cichlidogyrus casuarinus TaxID=1844966 RepID=A0ABD2QGS4_9PLAT
MDKLRELGVECKKINNDWQISTMASTTYDNLLESEGNENLTDLLTELELPTRESNSQEKVEKTGNSNAKPDITNAPKCNGCSGNLMIV